MLPIHAPYVPDNRNAHAPYNFVPLPAQIVQAEQPLPTHDAYHTDRYTGRIACTLTTASPLYVRCGLTPEQLAQGIEAKDLPDFFYLWQREQPVIPGSSLRGMLRALVEIVGYGKMDKVTDQPRYFYRAVAAKNDDPLAMPYRAQLRGVRAGYLLRRGREWFIRPARAIGNEPYLKVREQDIPPALGLVRLSASDYCLQTLQVSFTTKKLNPSPRNPHGRLVVDLIGAPGKHSEAGWLVTSGNMIETGQPGQPTPRKNHAVILEASSGEIKIADAAVDDYRKGLSDFQIDQLGPDGVLQDGRPVFYCEPPRGEREVIYFGHSPNFRLPFRFPGSQRAATPLDFVPERLRDDAQIDLAEAIFGFVRRTKKTHDQAVAGRVFVGDATLDAGQEAIWYSDEPITPRILATPKPTTFQHYLVQPSAERPALKHYASKPGDETVVRGHKLYWHKGDQPDIGLPEAQQQIKDTQKTQILPVRAGVRFTFDVRFENLSKVELGALLWVLELAADERYRLKLGMGKPLGMGALQIEHSVQISLRGQRYATLFDGDDWALGDDAPMHDDERSGCIAEFERYVLAHSGEPADKLENTLRMRCLLALLAWPGPLPEMTRYLEIERDARQGVIPAANAGRGEQKANEYKLRPVLPLPQQITGEPIAASAMPPAAQSSIAERPPEPSKPAGPRIPIEGDIFTGLVLERDERMVIVEVPGFGHDRALGMLKVEPDTPKWAPGKDRARVEVIGTREQGERTILDLKRGPKMEKK